MCSHVCKGATSVPAPVIPPSSNPPEIHTSPTFPSQYTPQQPQQQKYQEEEAPDQTTHLPAPPPPPPTTGALPPSSTSAPSYDDLAARFANLKKN